MFHPEKSWEIGFFKWRGRQYLYFVYYYYLFLLLGHFLQVLALALRRNIKWVLLSFRKINMAKQNVFFEWSEKQICLFAYEVLCNIRSEWVAIQTKIKTTDNKNVSSFIKLTTSCIFLTHW